MLNEHHPANTYIGRFAPSPTGPLHFGSLVSALASFLDARSHSGQWLVRMEDLDPPREQPGAADSILRDLEAHGLTWDGAVLHQSRRHAAYGEALTCLHDTHLVYPCSCTRQRLQLRGGTYDGHCARHPPASKEPTALRVRVNAATPITFHDLFQGQQQQNLADEVGDFILRRKDGLFAYQLAVVVDDIYQKVTHIIRGSDLLDSTPRQLWLYQCLGAKAPSHGHIPIALNRQGQKLSKQNLAPALEAHSASENLWLALQFLQQSPPATLEGAPIQELLAWAVEHWSPHLVPHTLGIEI